MSSSQLFLLIALGLVAPHLTWPEARMWSLVGLLLSFVFWLIDLWIKP